MPPAEAASDLLAAEMEGGRGTLIRLALASVGGISEDEVTLAVLDAGAEEVNDLGESIEVISEAGDLIAVRKALQEADPAAVRAVGIRRRGRTRGDGQY